MVCSMPGSSGEINQSSLAFVVEENAAKHLDPEWAKFATLFWLSSSMPSISKTIYDMGLL